MEFLEDVGEITVRRVPRTRLGGAPSKWQDEAVVVFRDREFRDGVRSAAFNLAGQDEAGIRLDVPEYLMSNFKALEGVSYDLKQKHGGVKRNIRYDDEVMDLVLDFKIDEEAGWKRIRPQEARKTRSGRTGRNDREEVSLEDLLGILGGPANERSGSAGASASGANAVPMGRK